MTEQKTTSPTGAIGGILGLGMALYFFGPCAKPAPKWTHEGDGSFDTYRTSETIKEELRKDFEGRRKIEKDVRDVLDALNEAEQD
jgi:hypothetical protein